MELTAKYRRLSVDVTGFMWNCFLISTTNFGATIKYTLSWENKYLSIEVMIDLLQKKNISTSERIKEKITIAIASSEVDNELKNLPTEVAYADVRAIRAESKYVC